MSCHLNGQPVRRDEGSGTLAAAVTGVLLVGVAVFVVAGAETSLARHRLAGVADVTALGAAQAIGSECERAGEIARLNNVVLLDCHSDGLDVLIEISAPIPEVTSRLMDVLGQRAGTFSARARAGW